LDRCEVDDSVLFLLLEEKRKRKEKPEIMKNQPKEITTDITLPLGEIAPQEQKKTNSPPTNAQIGRNTKGKKLTPGK
jgi:hypothetical protein